MGDPELAVQAVLTDDVRDWLLAELRYAVLAVNTPDRPPAQSVMWFDLDPNDRNVILMNTMVRRLKYRQLQADPHVSVLFEAGTVWIGMRGTVEPASATPSQAVRPCRRAAGARRARGVGRS